MDARGDNWRWNTAAHGAPRVQAMQVIDNPNEKPRTQPYGFAPKHPAVSQQRRQSVFPPQIAARQRI